MRPARARPAPPSRGAALLLAMVILTLVATLAAGMVWQQSRAVAVEAAERGRAQAGWLFAGAIDIVRLYLRSDATQRRGGGSCGPEVDGRDEAWATRLEEAPLSSLLAADKDNNAGIDLQAFFSGGAQDMQGRFNLRNLVDAEGKLAEAEVLALRRLVEILGLPADTTDRLAQGLRAAWSGAAEPGSTAPLAPRKAAQLTWLGVDRSVAERLAPFVALLPATGPRTALNVNTASPEVLAAVLALDPARAGSIARRAATRPFCTIAELRSELAGVLPPEAIPDDGRIGLRSAYFLVDGRLRLDDRVVEETALLWRQAENGGRVEVLWRERSSLQIPR